MLQRVQDDIDEDIRKQKGLAQRAKMKIMWEMAPIGGKSTLESNSRSMETSNDNPGALTIKIYLVDLSGSFRRFSRLPAQPLFKLWSLHPVK